MLEAHQEKLHPICWLRKSVLTSVTSDGLAVSLWYQGKHCKGKQIYWQQITQMTLQTKLGVICTCREHGAQTVSQGKLQRVHREVWLWSFIRWLNLLVTKLRVTVSFLLCLYTIISSYSPIICNRQASYVTHNSALHWFSFFLFVCFFYVFELFDGNALKSTSVDFSVGGSTDC